jgi:hypothetical protein
MGVSLRQLADKPEWRPDPAKAKAAGHGLGATRQSRLPQGPPITHICALSIQQSGGSSSMPIGGYLRMGETCRLSMAVTLGGGLTA